MQLGASKLTGVLVLLAIMSTAPFAASLTGDFVWDDRALIVDNAFVQDWSQIKTALTSHFWDTSHSSTPGNPIYSQIYRPVVTFSYLVQFNLFDGNPIGFRFVSLALHLLCTLLAFTWLERRIGRIDRVWPLVLGAIIFAIHPTRPESVAWISGCTDLWMTFFVLLGALLWSRREKGVSRSVLAGLCFSLAILAKEVAVVVPVLLAADAWLLSEHREEKPLAVPLTVVSSMIAATLTLRFWLVPLKSSGGGSTLTELIERVLASYGYYVEIVLWPWEPSSHASDTFHILCR